MSAPSIEDVKQKIRNYVEKSLPGAYQLLDMYCKKHSSKNCVSLLIEDPSTFRDVLINVYGLQPGVELIVYIYLTQLVLELNPCKSIDELVFLLINNPNEFKKIVSSLIKK